jgi:predicted RNA-binding protein with PUA-like domain
MACWLLKSDPDDYSFEDLVRDRRTRWDGVRNALALKHLRAMKRGDEVFVYHTGKEKAVVGTARVVRAPYPDPQVEDPKLAVVDLQAGRTLRKAVPLASIKAEPSLSDFDLVRLPRLSVMPVTTGQKRVLTRLSS